MKVFKKNISMIMRGYKILLSTDKYFLILHTINAFTDSLFPFVNLYMSSKIITELSTYRRQRELIIYAVVTITINLGLSVFNQLIYTKKNKYSNLIHRKMSLFYNDANNNMQYEHIENPETRFRRDRIFQNQNWTGSGILKLIWEIYSIVNSIFTIIFSLSLTVSMFYLYSPNDYTGVTAFINSSYSVIIIMIVIIINSVINIWCDKTQTVRSTEASKDVPQSNRLLNFYEGIVWNYIGAMDIRIFNKTPIIWKELSKHNDNPAHLKVLVKIRLYFGSIRILLNKFTTIAIYSYIGVKAYIGAFGIGNFIMYTGAIWQFTSGVSGLCSSIVKLLNNNTYLREVFDYIDMPNTMQQGTMTVEKRANNEYGIEFHDVSFKYPGTDTYAIKNLNFKFHTGQRLAVVGMNGSGKTTMIKLLCRLYDPTEGKITLDGIDIKKYDYTKYIALFSVVFQDFKLLAFTLGQNVAASDEYDSAKATKSLEMAGFGSRLSDMPKGLDTSLYKNFEEDGVEISGGEAQKVAIARALYKNAPFIVLDEPTAALDPIAEFEVYSKFNEIVSNKTAIYISHRLSSCRFCDDIAVFHEGELIQRGNHNELIADESGKYYELWNAQAQYYVAPGEVGNL